MFCYVQFAVRRAVLDTTKARNTRNRYWLPYFVKNVKIFGPLYSAPRPLAKLFYVLVFIIYEGAMWKNKYIK